MDVKSARPVDIRTLGGGFPALYQAFTERSERARALKDKWEAEHLKLPHSKKFKF